MRGRGRAGSTPTASACGSRSWGAPCARTPLPSGAPPPAPNPSPARHATVCCYCMQLLNAATVCCYCILLLYTATVCCYCMLLPYAATVCCDPPLRASVPPCHVRA
eukprot:2042646-Rhodomonas_salina.1